MIVIRFYRRNERMSSARTPRLISFVVHSPGSSFFLPDPSCPNNRIGINCSTPVSPCVALNPCQHGNCSNDSRTLVGYTCSCEPGYNGSHCDHNQWPCRSNPCWNDGIECLPLTEKKCTAELCFRHVQRNGECNVRVPLPKWMERSTLRAHGELL